MNDALLVAFALLLIVALAIDNRHHPRVWTEKEDRHPHSGRRHFR